jgi:hypothetical protein
MRTVYAKHLPYDDGHLGKVAADMDHHGAPTIRVVEFDGELYAIEGSHRLAVAKERDIAPKLVVETTEDDALPSGHWKRVAATLPAYTFETSSCSSSQTS